MRDALTVPVRMEAPNRSTSSQCAVTRRSSGRPAINGVNAGQFEAAAWAGVIQSSQVYTASATFGEFGTELDVIAAVVLGGTSLQGGRGSVLQTVVGVL